MVPPRRSARRRPATCLESLTPPSPSPPDLRQPLASATVFSPKNPNRPPSARAACASLACPPASARYCLFLPLRLLGPISGPAALDCFARSHLHPHRAVADRPSSARPSQRTDIHTTLPPTPAARALSPAPAFLASPQFVLIDVARQSSGFRVRLPCRRRTQPRPGITTFRSCFAPQGRLLRKRSAASLPGTRCI